MVALGLGLFAFSLLIAAAIGWQAASRSRAWDESKHVNLVTVMLPTHTGNGNGNGKQ